VSTSTTSHDHQIVRAASVVMFGFIASSLTGLASSILVSHAFGTSSDLDAFFAANRLPETLFNLMAGGALASAFLPTFTGFLTRDDRSGAWRLASSVANLVLVILGLVSLICWFAAPWLVTNVVARGFEDQQQIDLTVSLLRIMLISPVIFSMSGLLMATLNAHQHFALPALAPAAYRLGMIISVLVLVPRYGIHGLAWGVVLGATMHLAIQLPALRGLGPRYNFQLGYRNPAVQQVGRLMVPRLLGAAVVQINFIANVIIASGQPEGSLAAITFAFQLMIMPQAVIAQAIAIAALPTFSAQVARGKIDEMRASLTNTLRGVIFLSLPASLGLMLMRRPVVALLLQRGEFTTSSTELVAWALLWYAAGLVGHSILEIIVRAYYAMQDTRTPVIVGAIAMSLNIIFSLGFSAMFARLGWPPHGGLALANSIATALEVATLMLLMRERFGGINIERIRRGLTASVIATILMGLILWFWLKATSGGSIYLVGVGGIVVGATIYWFSALALGSPEARQLPGILLRRGA
jgi:putative peptidoglycan lipid II flippase